MSDKIHAPYVTATTVYAQVWSSSTVWDADGGSFVTYNPANVALYDIALNEEGASGMYIGTMPAAIAAGTYTILAREQLGGAPAESDEIVASISAVWETEGVFQDLADIEVHGDATWIAASSATISAAVLAAPANKLVTDASGFVTAENMRGTDAANTTTPPTVGDIATAVWGAGTRTLTSLGTVVADVWAYVAGAGRTLTGFVFTPSVVPDPDVAVIRTETDKLADTLFDTGGGVYGFTGAALALAAKSDATLAKQNAILAAFTTPPSASTIATAVWASGTRTLTAISTALADGVALRVWLSSDRQLSQFDFIPIDPNTAPIKVVTDRLDDTLFDSGGGVYAFTANSLLLAPDTGDATEAKQNTIIAAVGQLNNPTKEAIATQILAEVIDGTVDVRTILHRLHQRQAGKIVWSGTNPRIATVYKEDGTTVLFTLSYNTGTGDQTRV